MHDVFFLFYDRNSDAQKRGWALNYVETKPIMPLTYVYVEVRIFLIVLKKNFICGSKERKIVYLSVNCRFILWTMKRSMTAFFKPLYIYYQLTFHHIYSARKSSTSLFLLWKRKCLTITGIEMYSSQVQDGPPYCELCVTGINVLLYMFPRFTLLYRLTYWISFVFM
jgi:hypothetical protein